jgi:hypothetical protein
MADGFQSLAATAPFSGHLKPFASGAGEERSALQVRSTKTLSLVVVILELASTLLISNADPRYDAFMDTTDDLEARKTWARNHAAEVTARNGRITVRELRDAVKEKFGKGLGSADAVEIVVAAKPRDRLP